MKLFHRWLNAMAEINKLTGRNYQLFNYYGDPNADRVIIAMGSLCDTAMEVVDYLNAKGEKVGVVSIHLYRPFSVKHFLNALPKTVKKIAVMDRTKKKLVLSAGEPLYLEIQSALYNSDLRPTIVGGRYGLGGKDVTPRSNLCSL